MAVAKNEDTLLQTDTRITFPGGLIPSEVLVPTLTVLWHPEVQRVGELALLSSLLSPGSETELSRVKPDFGQPGEAVERPLSDPHLSRSPIRLALGNEGSIHLDCHNTSTRVVIDDVPIASGRFISPEELDRGVVLLLANRVALLLHRIKPIIFQMLPRFGMVGDSMSMIQLRDDVQRVSDLDVPVLLRGETGTGKELVAQGIHKAGTRKKETFVAINMGAVPPTLAASELFGAVKGAFTGADRKRSGYFSQAEDGTLFLDEIGETPPEVQVLLLRALETREILPVGSDKAQKVDVRLIAATDADLEEAVEADRFRAPLLHRLSGYEIHLPPLRARRDDFGRLFQHFLHEELETVGERHRLDGLSGDLPWMPASLVARLARLEWPGNVRQLRNVVRQLVIANRGAATVRMGPQIERLLSEGAVSPSVSSQDGVPVGNRVSSGSASNDPPTSETKAEPPASPVLPRSNYRSPSAIQEDDLIEVLRSHRWELKPTAEELGISRTSLYDLIKKSSRIRKANDLSREEIEACQESCNGDLMAMVDTLEVSQRGLLRRMGKLGMR